MESRRRLSLHVECSLLTRNKLTSTALAQVKPGKPPQYFEAWIIRTLMISKMRHAGVRRLRMAGMTAAQFQSMFSDQGAWIKRATSRAGVKSALESLGYDGPPELYSMWACMFHDPSCHMHTGVLSEVKIVQARGLIKWYMDEHGMMPHPAILLQQL